MEMGREKKDVSSYYKSYDYLIHPSIYEGLPNVICEALLDGMPVLASNVCDNGLLVREGERGFLLIHEVLKIFLWQSLVVLICLMRSTRNFLVIVKNMLVRT